MSRNDLPNRISDEDIRKLRRTVKRIPANNTRQHNSKSDINRRRTKQASRKNSRICYILMSLGALAIVAAIIVIVLINKPEKTDAITGRWSLDDVTVYSFDGNGHGVMDLPLNTYEFSYVVESDKIKIDFANESAEDKEYSYMLSGDTLTLTGADGAEYRFTKYESLKGQTE